jgi:hypothetical protein
MTVGGLHLFFLLTNRLDKLIDLASQIAKNSEDTEYECDTNESDTDESDSDEEDSDEEDSDEEEVDLLSEHVRNLAENISVQLSDLNRDDDLEYAELILTSIAEFSAILQHHGCNNTDKAVGYINEYLLDIVTDEDGESKPDNDSKDKATKDGVAEEDEEDNEDEEDSDIEITDVQEKAEEQSENE